MFIYYCFFFSSRRRHTRWPRDWSSDVCSSDLFHPEPGSDADVAGSTASGAEGAAREGTVRPPAQIGRASCRERVWVSGGAGAVEKTQKIVGARGVGVEGAGVAGGIVREVGDSG